MTMGESTMRHAATDADLFCTTCCMSTMSSCHHGSCRLHVRVCLSSVQLAGTMVEEDFVVTSH